MAQFSKRHYEFLARILKREIEVARDLAAGSLRQGSEEYRIRAATLEGFTRLLASELKSDNSAFDRARFLQASGNVQ